MLSSTVPGRVRLRVASLQGQHLLASSLVERMATDTAVRDVEANAITGSLLVRFDPARLDTRRLTALVRRHSRELGNGHNGHHPGAETAWHTLPAGDVVRRLGTSPDQGLSSSEAIARLDTLGGNRLPVPQPKTSLEILAGHVSSLPVLLLGGAAVLSIVSGAPLEAAAILAVIAANGTIGYLTERRVERILTSLHSSRELHAFVRRDGVERAIPAHSVVPGDVLLLKAGHDVPADARVVDGDGLSVDESALTGESVPVAKQAAAVFPSNGALAERANMVYAGTVVSEGSATAVVTATGRHTELGRIRALVAETSAPSTPLERQLEQAGRRLAGLSLGACAAVLGLGVLRGVPVLEMLRSAVSLAVAAVPEGLPAVATTTLALGVDRMMKRGTLVRRLAAVESLGAITVICVDKTGTLTENRMTVDSWWAGGREYGRGAALAMERASDPALARAMSIAVLCNEAELAAGNGVGMGSSTESALLEAALEAGVDYRLERQRYPLRSVRPRRDGQHWMATVHQMNGQMNEGTNADSTLITMKGAPEQVLARADGWIRDGRHEPLTAADKRGISAMNDRIAARGLRMLGLAFKTVRAAEAPSYHGFTLAGLVALTDPIRPGVPEAIRACRTAGIRPVVLTGDHARTAAAVYGELGRGHGRAKVFDASHVGDIGADELGALVREIDVFARVSPRDKYRIVRALQAAGEVVAMTGDGINDAAALRAADIGVAMGARGTDVARDVADVVLVGDDFDGIVAAIEQGRTIHANIGKALRFLLSTNVSEILVTLGGLALGIPRPMSAIQFLWINLLSDVAPALALAVEPAEADVMTRPPRDPAAPMLARPALFEIGRDASMLAVTALAAHGVGLARYGAGPQATSVAFSTLTTAQLLHALTYRSGVAGSRVLLGTVAGTIGLQMGAMIVPPLRSLLGLTPLGLGDWGLVLGGAALPFVVKEIGRRRRTV
ncbi:MAG TPA: HAD-IC family P-type ATPase [Methylomirabilota bacterium]